MCSYLIEQRSNLLGHTSYWLQAIDKDGSGSIDQSELSKLGGNMTKVSLSFLFHSFRLGGGLRSKRLLLNISQDDPEAKLN